MLNTILTMSNGRGIDLLDPKIDDIDFLVIAEHLAKDNRYCGATKGLIYSVAEHSVRGVNAIIRETRDRTLAAYFLCHDMHEAYLGDDTTPKKHAIGIVASKNFGALAEHIVKTFDLLTERFDVAIHRAAGLGWPALHDISAGVKYYDKCMLATEWRDLMKCEPPYKFEASPLDYTIVPQLDWKDAAEQFEGACADLLPNFAIHQKLIGRKHDSQVTVTTPATSTKVA